MIDERKKILVISHDNDNEFEEELNELYNEGYMVEYYNSVPAQLGTHGFLHSAILKLNTVNEQWDVGPN